MSVMDHPISESQDVSLQGVEKLRESNRWYRFLNSLYINFSKYEIQKNVSKFNVVNMEDWGERNRPNGININKKNYKQFMEKITPYDVAEHSAFEKREITDLQFKELNYVLELTLKYKIEVSCTESYKIIKGNNIVIKNIMNHINLDHTCQKKKETEKLKGVVIFALNTIFIDKDIERPELPITMIAPKWEVIGKRTIDISGFEGDHFKSIHDSIVEEIDGQTRPGADGKNGKPGLAGGPGGQFFGIGQNFENGRHLTIIANGGKGGTGENGFNGSDGEYGAAADPPAEIKCDKDICVKNKEIDGKKCIQLSCLPDTQLKLFPKINCVVEIFGDEGEKGGNGGHGGHGGKGGKAGKIELFELDEKSEFAKYEFEGTFGRNGTGGIGGHGGKHGDNLLVSCYSSWFNSHFEPQTVRANVTAPNGHNGVLGANAKFIENPKKMNNAFKHAKIIIDYKSYLRENLKNYYGTPTLIRFLHHLDNDRKIKSMYNTLALYNELESLEKSFYKLNVGVGFLPFYTSLLDRILEYSQYRKENELGEQYTKALTFLYSSTLVRIKDMQKNLESSLITNIEEHLTSVKSDVEKLKTNQLAKNKADLIQKYKKNFKDQLDKKIQQARNIIETQILPDINEANSRIDKNVEKLVLEVVNKENKDKFLIEHQKKSREELKKALRLKAIFGVIEYASQAVGYLGPVGAFVGGAVGEVNSVAKSLMLDKENVEMKLMELPPSVINHIHEGKNLVISMMQEKVNRFHTYLDDVSTEIGKNPEHYGQFSTKLEEIRSKLHEVQLENFDMKKVNSLENEFKEELDKTNIELKNKSGKDERLKTVSEKIEVYADRFQKVYQFGMGIFELVQNFKNDQEQVHQITDVIEENQEHFQQLKSYEEEIYNTISPTLNDMKDDMKNVQDKLKTKSTVELDVTKYQIQNVLKKVKDQVKKMVDGFNDVSDDLVQCFEKLNESMDILIDVYTHIQDDYREQNWADYLADINSAPANSISITDAKLDKVINELEILIRSNLILQRYQVSFDAFKEFVFPFADLYLDDTTLPSVLTRSDNLGNLAFQVINQIDTMLANLRTYINSITQHKNGLGTGHFNSRATSLKPFFKWENKKYHNNISKLLSGNREVMFKADINKSNVSEDAIKFSSLAVYFKSNNETTLKQQDLNEILKAFRIDLVHMGKSYYRYNNKTYVIPTSQYKLWYNLEADDKGEPLKKGSEFYEIQRGDYMLSPYASWQFKLTNLDNDKNISFKNLTVLKDYIDLELEGYASFVDKKESSKDIIDLDKFYKGYEKDEIAVNSVNSDPESLEEKIEKIYQSSKIGTNSEKYPQSNSGLSSQTWFSWKLPNFNILPVAQAFSTEEMNLLNQRNMFFKLNFESPMDKLNDFIVNSKNIPKTEDQNLSYSLSSSLPSYFSNVVRMVKNIFSSENLSPVSGSAIYPEKIILNHNKNQILKDKAVSGLIKAESAKKDTSNIGKAAINIDFVNGNLILAQLILGKLFGANDALHSTYLSPDQEKIIKINQLSEEILSMKHDYEIDQINNELNNNKNTPQWYKDLYDEL